MAEIISVEEVLVKADLVKYVPTFAEEEIDSLEMLRALNNDDLKELGLTLGARKRLHAVLSTTFSESSSNAVAASSTSSPTSNSEQQGDDNNVDNEEDPEKWRERLSKLLSWMLRFGIVDSSALDESRCRRKFKARRNRKKLKVTLYRGGYVLLRELVALPQLVDEPLEQVLAVLRTSRSPDGLSKRFETCRVYGNTFARACYGHGFDVDALGGESPNTAPKDEDSERRWSVRSLADQCWDVVVAAMRSDGASLVDTMPAHVMPLLVERLKSENRLNNAALRALLTPKLRVVDLSNVYIGAGSLRRVANCTQANALVLTGCGVDVTDRFVDFVCKRIGPTLRTVGIANLKYVTNASLDSIARYCGILESLDIADLANITEPAVESLVERCPTLATLTVSTGNAALSPYTLRQLETNYPRLKVVHRPTQIPVITAE